MSRIFALLGINSSTQKVEALCLSTDGDKPHETFQQLCSSEGYLGEGKTRKHFYNVQLSRDGVILNSRKFSTPEEREGNEKSVAAAEAERATAESKKGKGGKDAAPEPEEA